MHLSRLLNAVLLSLVLVATLAAHAGAAPLIRFGEDGALDMFRFHGRVTLLPPELGGPIDPVTDGFAIELTNNFGRIYLGGVNAGDLEYAGKNRYRFKDPAATVGAGSRDGIYLLLARFRMYSGVWFYTVKVIAYGDFSLAIDPLMTVGFHHVGEPAAVTAEWVPSANGWRLPLNRFPDVQ